jgi:transcriptional regulator with XRE-family HTH domain
MSWCIGDRLTALLEERGMTQAELSRRSGVSRQSISGYVSNEVGAGKKRIARFAEALGITPTEFMISGVYGKPRPYNGHDTAPQSNNVGMARVRQIIGPGYIHPDNRELAIRTPPEYGAVLCEDGRYRQ